MRNPWQAQDPNPNQLTAPGELRQTPHTSHMVSVLTTNLWRSHTQSQAVPRSNDGTIRCRVANPCSWPETKPVGESELELPQTPTGCWVNFWLTLYHHTFSFSNSRSSDSSNARSLPSLSRPSSWFCFICFFFAVLSIALQICSVDQTATVNRFYRLYWSK